MSNATNIDNLPDEILSIIFEFVCGSNRKEVYSLIQTCVRWKNVLESYYVFGTNKIFANRQPYDDDDFLMALECKRKFRGIEIYLDNENVEELEKIRQLIEKGVKTLDVVNLTLGCGDHAMQVSFEFFYTVWSYLKNFESIEVNFENFGFYEINKDPSREQIEFERLKSLKIKWKRNNYWFKHFFGENYMYVFYERLKEEKESEEKQECDSEEEQESPNNEDENSIEKDVNLDGLLEKRTKKADKLYKQKIDKHEEKIQLEEIISRALLNYTKISQLESLYIDAPGYHFSNTVESFLKFANQCPESISFVYLWSENSYGFEWDTEKFAIWYNPEMRHEFTIFVENQCVDLREFVLHWWDDKEFINKVFDNSGFLSHFETSVELVDMFDEEIFPELTQLTLWKYRVSREKLIKLKQNFPNIQVLRFMYTPLTYEQRDLMLEVFPQLKDLQTFNTATKAYESVLK